MTGWDSGKYHIVQIGASQMGFVTFNEMHKMFCMSSGKGRDANLSTCLGSGVDAAELVK